MKQKLSLTLVIIFLSSLLIAQKDPIKWGKIPDEDLKMTVYAPDTSAAALVLGSYGELEFAFSNSGPEYRFDYHRRVKILKKAGFDEGDVTIYKRPSEKITDIDAQIFLPDGTEIEVDNDDIFKEETDDYWTKYKFTFPSMVEGAIIEFRYKKTSESIITLERWYFQEEHPVVISELRTTIPEWYNYVMITQGRPLDINETETKERTMMVPDYQYNVAGILEQRGFDQAKVRMNMSRYAMQDVPALKEEAYITTMEDYLAKADWQLASVMYPRSPVKSILSTWPEVAKELYDHDKFGGQFTKKRKYNDILDVMEKVVKGVSDKTEIATRIYYKLASEMEWNGEYSYLTDNDLEDCYEQKKGNSAELNLMLLALLKEYEIEAYPLLISTRGHGKMQPLYPLVQQFNHVVVLAKMGDQMTLMDVGDPNRPVGFMRETANNGQGWLVDLANSQWVVLNSPAAKQVVSAKLKLDETGTLSGKIQQMHDGYFGVRLRNEWQDDKDGKFLKEELAERFPDIETTEISFKDAENVSKGMSSSIQCTIPGGAESVDDFMYLTPDILPAFSENPFKLTERTYPVDMPYGLSHQVILNFELPEGYVIDGLPEAVNMATEDRGVTYSLNCSQIGGNLQVISRLNIEKLKFEPDEYAGLKNFFDILIEKQTEPIVLKRKT